MIEGLFQPMHLVIIFAVALFFCFGPKKLPDLGNGIAEGIGNFKSGLKESDSESSCSSFSEPRGNIGLA